MKNLLLAIALLAPVVSLAQPASKIAWTPETLNLVKKGDPNKGKLLAESCKSCHGDKGEGIKAEIRDGETIPAIPTLAGQLPTYTYKQLRDYFNGSRTNGAMTAIAKGLGEQDATDLAPWFGALPIPQDKGGKTSARAEKLVGQGDGKRILPPCSVCHGGDGQGGKLDIPALAEQPDYLAGTLQAYKSGVRHNDVYSRMRLIAQQLSDAEIKELADYYQTLK